MKNHIVTKALAIFLATVFLTLALGSALCAIALADAHLYSHTPQEEYEIYMYSERQDLAVDLVYSYAVLKLGGIPEEYFHQYYDLQWQDSYFRADRYFYSIFDENGSMVESTVPEVPENGNFYEIPVTGLRYRRLASPGETPNTAADNYYDPESGRYVQICYETELLEPHTVQLYLLEDAYRYDAPWQLLQRIYPARYHLFWILGGSLLLFLAFAILLCCSAGRRRGTAELCPGGLNRLPLDLYTAAAVGAEVFLSLTGFVIVRELRSNMPVFMLCLLLCIAALGSLTAVALLFAWAAQLKMRRRCWLKHTLIGRFLRWLCRGARRCFRAAHSFLRLLPVIWQWALVMAVMLLIPFIFLLLSLISHEEGFFLALFLLSAVGDLAAVLYGAYCFGILMRGVRRMSRGDLSEKLSTRHLYGCFRDFALHLNALSEAASLAADRQLRSERMKTELITNVSHDIKTPLTSIINFVDLLQKPHTQAQEQEYLEVLSRQSAQMKKLIEDLMELSKANSGNLTVNPERIDAVEAVNQALGEFSDKLEQAGLIPIFRRPEQPVYITADGRHMWRVLSNLLTNAVKYALPGTRLYIDLAQRGPTVQLSIKNVSREELNISADELMERFVQGDASRKSEGSGLGLNIAKSLMEVQHGQLQLLLDGDLFKVILTFPALQENF